MTVKALVWTTPGSLPALAIGAFGIGTTEFVITGLLPEVATDFGVSIPTAGFMVTGYALGVVLGAPLMTILGTKVSRKRMLMGLFIAGNVVSAVAPVDQAAGAPTLASANIGAFNLGNALSAWLGGVVIAAGFGYTAPNWVGAALAASALALAVILRLLERREVTTHSRVVSASALDTAAVPAARR